MIEIEFAVLHVIQSFRTEWLDSFMTAVTSLGDKGWFWIVTGLVLFCFKKSRRMGACLLLSLACGFLIGNVALKHLVSRNRPCWLDASVPLLIENPKDFSFPSGHTLASLEGAVTILLYNKRWGIPALILALLIAFSRLYLYVHFPTDVLAGLFLGVIIAVVVHRAVERYCGDKGPAIPANNG